MTIVSPSDTDLSLPGILDDCRHGLMRCERQEASYMMWAVRWGRALVDRAETPDEMSVYTSTLEAENTELEDSSKRLRWWVGDAIDELERADDDALTKSEIRKKINDIIQLLQKVL